MTIILQEFLPTFHLSIFLQLLNLVHIQLYENLEQKYTYIVHFAEVKTLESQPTPCSTKISFKMYLVQFISGLQVFLFVFFCMSTVLVLSLVNLSKYKLKDAHILEGGAVVRYLLCT